MDYAIILGGGKGLRMGADVPKQFIEVGGLPILMRTIMRFREYGDVKIILVLPKDQQDYWHQLCQKHHFDEDYQIADGGSERFFSIKNALALIPDDAQGVVAVHDGVRPFPSVEVIARCFETARQTGTAVPVVPVVETLRKVEAHPQPLPKGGEFDATTPGTTTTSTSQNPSLREGLRDGFTDDASVVEAYWETPHQLPRGGEQEASPRGKATGRRACSGMALEGVGITLVEGNRENIKITTPFDLIVAESIILHATTQDVSGTE